MLNTVYKNIMKLTVCIALSAVTFQAKADETILELSVTGSIIEPPKWVNGFGNVLRSAVFNFTQLAKSEPFAHVESDPLGFKLINIDSYPANIQFLKPQNCKIGSTAINDDHITLVRQGAAISKNGTVAISDQELVQYSLRFDAAGGYANKSGMVSCDASGTMIYVY